MENTLEDKRIFTALYYGQNVLRYINWPDNFEVTELDGRRYRGWGADPQAVDENAYLELKSLSSISDEDAIEVAKIMKVDIENQLTNQIIEYIHGCITHFNCKGDMSFKIADYLRSRGYALPWMELSVEELVNIGWVKLKGETK